jgi:hypothetical protein
MVVGLKAHEARDSFSHQEGHLRFRRLAMSILYGAQHPPDCREWLNGAGYDWGRVTVGMTPKGSCQNRDAGVIGRHRSALIGGSTNPASAPVMRQPYAQSLARSYGSGSFFGVGSSGHSTTVASLKVAGLKALGCIAVTNKRNGRSQRTAAIYCASLGCAVLAR